MSLPHFGTCMLAKQASRSTLQLTLITSIASIQRHIANTHSRTALSKDIRFQSAPCWSSVPDLISVLAVQTIRLNPKLSTAGSGRR